MASIAFSPAPARTSVNGLAHPAVVGRRREGVRHWWVVVLAGGYLAAVLLSRWDWPAIIVAAVSIMILVVRLAVLGRIDRIGWAVVVYLALLTAYGLAVGSAPSPSDLKSFLSFEGRVYIAYLPILVFATATVTRADLGGVRRLMRWSVVFGGALLVLWQLGVDSSLGSHGDFVGLTSSHHASGLFFALASLILLMPGVGGRRTVDVLLGLAALGIVLASGSRTAIVGLLFAAIYLVASSRSAGYRIRLVTLLALAAVAAMLLSSRLLSTVEYLGSPAFFQEAATQFSRSAAPEQGKGLGRNPPLSSEISNILVRFGVWRASLDEIGKSPVVGIGPWRLNDTNRREVGIPGLVVLALDGDRISVQGFGAHNVVLQTIAETGILGLALLAAPWVLLIRRLRRRGMEARTSLALMVFSIGTLLTSNAMISPALCFPLFAYVMIAARLEPMSQRVDDEPQSRASAYASV